MYSHILQAPLKLKDTLLASYYYDGEIMPAFSLLNAVDGALVTVGSVVFYDVTVTGEVTWPGGTTDTPTNTDASIDITYCGGFIDGDFNVNEFMFLL